MLSPRKVRRFFSSCRSTTSGHISPNGPGDIYRATLAYDATKRAVEVKEDAEQLRGTDDKPLPRSFETATPLVTSTNGTLLLGVTDKSFTGSGVLRSTDGGDHWSYQEIPQNDPDNVETPKHSMPAVQQLRDGSLAVYTRAFHRKISVNPDFKKEFSFRSFSKDDGVTWSEAVASNVKNPNARLAWVNLSNDTYLLATNNMFRTAKDTAMGRRQLDLLRSTDDGTTWVDKTIEKNDRGEFSYPYMIQGTDGMTYVVYAARPSAIKWARFNAAWFDAANTDPLRPDMLPENRTKGCVRAAS